MCLAVLALLCGAAYADSRPTGVTIVYPHNGQTVHSIDSTFIFGYVSGAYDHEHMRVEINDVIVPVHRDGGFLAFLPVDPGSFTFLVQVVGDARPKHHELLLGRKNIVVETSVVVNIPQPVRSLPEDTLCIVRDYDPPSGDIACRAGDLVAVSFWGTPRCEAWFEIPGAVDSVPMVEAPPRQQSYWGESVFGAGAVPDSLLVRGIYSGYYRVPASVSVDTTAIIYHIVSPVSQAVKARAASTPFGWVNNRLLRFLTMPDSLSGRSSYRVTLNSPEFPFTVRLTDSVQTVRHGPRKGYFSILQPEGVEALVVAQEGGWYIAQLAPSQYAWIDTALAERVARGILPPKSYVKSLRTYGGDRNVRIELPLSGKHAYRVIEDDTRTIRLQLFGVTSDTDWIRYDFSDSLIDIATWSQPEPELWELRLRLTRDLWGYDVFYAGNTLNFVLNKAPQRVHTIWGKTIVVDPGHSSDPGAIGATGYTEAEANLGIALVLRDELLRRGANVVMTRDDASHVPLADRPVIAVAESADLFVSVHNNALPDGVNPFTNNGTSSYYYHPHSIELARSVQPHLVKATRLPDHGLFHGNLAVNRPTQYPAILVECAFMMIPEQEALLKTDCFRKRIARGIADGIEQFLEDYADGN